MKGDESEKLWKIVLGVIVRLSLYGCESKTSKEVKEEKLEKEEMSKISAAEQLEKDNPDLYERATGIMVQVNMDLENGLEGLSQVKKLTEYRISICITK